LSALPAIHIFTFLKLQSLGSMDDKSFSKSGIIPPLGLFPMRNGIHLQPVRAVLVRRGKCPAADAGGRRRLRVPGMFAEAGGKCGSQLRLSSERSPDAVQREAVHC